MTAAPSDDEDGAQDQRDDDAVEQHLVLVDLRDGERRQDDHEDEQVVDRQAQLGQVAGEELAAVVQPEITPMPMPNSTARPT